MEITAKNVAVIFVKIKNVTVLLANVFKVVPWDIKAHTVRKNVLLEDMEKTATILAVPTVLMVCVNGTMVTVKMDVSLAGKWDVVTKYAMISLLDMNVSELANVMMIWKFATNQLENACQAAYLDGKERTVPSTAIMVHTDPTVQYIVASVRMVQHATQ